MTINIISEYLPIVGGGGILAEELVKRLIERGHVINVITWGKPSVQKSKLHPNLTIYRVCKSSKISPIQKLKFGYFAGRKIKDLDGIVHGHIFFFPLDKKRTIYTFHVTQLGQLRALQKIKDKSIVIIISIMLKKLYLIWEKYIIKNSLKLIAVSNTVKNELLELGAKPEQIEIMPNPINLENYYRVDPEIIKQLRRKFSARSNTKLIFVIGRLSYIKGFQDLIKAVNLLKDKNIKLLIAGEGGYRQTLEQLSKDLEITNKVIFLGKIPKDEVKNFYSSTDVTVVPSLYDAFGLVILEAMACGSPLVCTNVCDFPLIAEEAAVYAKPHDPKDLAEKIRYVLAHQEKAKKMVEYGLNKVKNYTWEPYVEKLAKIYTEIDKSQALTKNISPRDENLIRNILLSISIIKTFKNWPYYFLTYFGFFKGKEIEYHFRNGVKLLVPVDPHSRRPMTDIWILRGYTPSGLNINNKDIVVDIGAHIGNFSIYAALLAKQGKVYAYEPVPENFRLLNHNIRLNNLNNIVPFNLIVSAGSRRRKRIYLTDSSATASLFGRRRQRFHPVKSVGLEDVFGDNGLKKINFLKIDCEGSEYDILFNTPKRYLSKIDRIAMEYHEGSYTKYKCQDLETFLRSHNFKVRVKASKSPREIRLGMLYAWRKK